MFDLLFPVGAWGDPFEESVRTQEGTAAAWSWKLRSGSGLEVDPGVLGPPDDLRPDEFAERAAEVRPVGAD